MTNNIYERQYQYLKHHGQRAWSGEGYERGRQALTAVLQSLREDKVLPPPGSVCLELGCGNGAMASLLLARAGYNVHGVDISATAIEWAQESFAAEGLSGSFRQGDVCTLDQYAGRQFDLVFDGSCLHCLINDQRARCFSQIGRVLKTDGMFIVSSMCGQPQRTEDQENYDAQHHHLMRDGRPWRTLRPLPRLIDELADNGFTVFRTAVNHNPWWDHATLCCRLA
ncbi:methyltransferase domain-containing protein [Affinibrenneria salicis]|uniref:Methyltransferase domain-containing protein n=1 Tax=Affinibrenneria salicis TaxID=2590031 RepID=A0A5J5FWV2_9GAMM|nr:class I SAM-dependent methyltransferase [Affinibrenneria salicis]KAA8997341.1 methyltransferase domain-containing protein [Affinibrenneria salicis]